MSYLALIGAGLSMVSNVPQVWKVRHRDTTKDFHVYSVVLHLSCAAVWSAYGYMLSLTILWIESATVSFFYGIILLAMWRDGHVFPKKPKPVETDSK